MRERSARNRIPRVAVNVSALQLRQRRGYWKTVVAIAAKNARMAWAVLRKGESFKLPVGPARGVTA